MDERTARPGSEVGADATRLRKREWRLHGSSRWT